MKIAVIGGMNLDLLAVPDGPLLPRDSNPGRVVMRAGGVGRNIAARLARMGAQASLLTALGGDDRAALLQAACRRDGIDLSLSVQTDAPSPCYLCIHDEAGDMALAVNDMSAMEKLTPETLAPLIPQINGFDGCVLDANLPQETLEYIGRRVSIPLILDPVSCAKAPRAIELLPHLAAIKPNHLEARALTGQREPAAAARALLRAGVRRVFISMGAQGVYYADENEQGLCPAIPLPAVPLTGAGDALCAGITLAVLEDSPISACASAGCQAAYEALRAHLGENP